jgi:DNA (cytosine-5)-methyltransferase 1
MITTGSDFSGVGAFDQALKRLNIDYKTIFACDMDKYARQTYIDNFNEPIYYPKNVYERDIPKKSIDIYMTSPPCQAFSLAGKRKGETEKRGILFYNSHEFILENKPRFFIFENVKGLLSDDGGKTFQRWIDYLGGKSVNGNPTIFPHEESVPYHIYYKVLNSKDYGVPQNRERIFIIGIREDSDNNFSFPKPYHLVKRLKDVLEDTVEEKYFLSEKMTEKITFELKNNGEVANLNKGGERGSVYGEKTDAMSCLTATDYKQPKQVMIEEKFIQGGLQNNQPKQTNGISPCLTSAMGMGGGQTPIHNYSNKIRKLTPRECFRLMDFDENFKWTVSDSQAYKQAGNSIVVNVLCEIIKKLKL